MSRGPDVNLPTHECREKIASPPASRFISQVGSEVSGFVGCADPTTISLPVPRFPDPQCLPEHLGLATEITQRSDSTPDAGVSHFHRRRIDICKSNWS